MNRAAFAALVPAAVLLPVAARAAQKVTITVSSGEIDNGAYFIAAQKGYFAAEGLDADLVFAGGGVATPALISGTVEASASSASALTAIMRGAALRIVLVFNETPIYQLWASREVRVPADLAGKSIGIATLGDTLEISSRLALLAAGVPAGAVGFTPMGSSSDIGAGLETGRLPAVVLTPARVAAMQAAGQLKTAHMLLNYFHTVHMPLNGLAVSEKLLYGDPVLARKIVRAIVKGARYLETFRAQSIALVAKYETKIDQHANETEYDQVVRAFTRDFTVSNEAIAADMAVRAELMGLPKDKVPPIDKSYDFSLVRSVNAELAAARWKPVA